MTGRRSSARLAAHSSSQGSQNSSPPPPKSSPPSKKRKNETTTSSPSAKRGKTNAEPQQKTLEETIQNGVSEQPALEKPDEEMSDKDDEKPETLQDDKPEEPQTEQTNGSVSESKQEDVKAIEKKEEIENEEAAAETAETKEKTKPTETNGNAVEPGARSDDEMPSTILEKGVIYFFFRPRVNVDDPQDVNDIARSFMIMRPIPLDAKIGDGPIGDEKNCRLLALPKKVLPKSGKDKFVTFVENCKTSFSELKESFLTGSEYETKTLGTRHTAPVTPLAEGIYAITSTGRESHLAYIVNIPSELGEVQTDFGLKQRGSFVASVKNPDQPPTAGAQQQNVPPGPQYPKEIIEEFGGLRWKPLEPHHLDYDQASFLIIGEDFEKATEGRPKDEREGNAPSEKEIEKLEGEDEIRIKHLKGDDAIFTDLHVTSKDIPEVRTSW